MIVVYELLNLRGLYTIFILKTHGFQFSIINLLVIIWNSKELGS